MKNIIYVIIIASFLLFPAIPSPVLSASSGSALENAAFHRKAALEQYEETIYEIGRERAVLQAELTRLDSSLIVLKADNARLQSELDQLMDSASILRKSRANIQEDVDDLASVIRIMQKDLLESAESSNSYHVFKDEFDRPEGYTGTGKLPTLTEVTALIDILFKEMEFASIPLSKPAAFIGRDGKETKGEILTFGRFLNAYFGETETGFLWISQSVDKPVAYAGLPETSIRDGLEEFASGSSEVIALDLSGGAATARYAKRGGGLAKIREGGPLVWPILAIGVAAALIISERLLTHLRSRSDFVIASRLVEQLAGHASWETVSESLSEDKPLQRVLGCAVSNREEERESLETLVHEAVLREARLLERFLPTLNVLGAIAPLLGLLGTVTGMISTFQSITLYGTGDPRMMAGGIAEALITTMLGLIVAIPIMFFHNFLSRRGMNLIEDIEEKVVMVVGMILKHRTEQVIPEAVK